MAFASTEFIALCQSQILLLTRALEANSTVIYLAEQANNSAGLSLVPLVAYPETAEVWSGLTEALAMMAEQLPADHPPSAEIVPGDGLVSSTREAHPGLGEQVTDLDCKAVQAAQIVPGASRPQTTPPRPSRQTALPPGVDRFTQSPHPPQETSTSRTPLVLPLVHEGMALGMMVSTRDVSPWSRDERQQAEQVANTLALAWVLDQRGQWLQQQLQQRHLTQTSQSETFHDLLHQFRNPLTALQTFGRLLVKRIPEGDPNQPIAEGIVRESRRLQDLAETFDETIAQGDESLQTAPAVPPPAGRLLPGNPALDNLEADLLGPPQSRDLAVPAPIHDRHQNALPRLGRSLQVVPGHLTAVVMPLLQSAWAIAQERGLHLEYDLPADLPMVGMDGAALAEVVSNLLDNALKYSPAGALVWVMGGLVQSLDGQLFQGLAIGDTGNGIPVADQPHIFERHFRGVQAAGDIPGTGLGLAIAQELVASMGGHLELRSPVAADHWITLPKEPIHQGPGTLFVIWLPTASDGPT